MKLLIALLVAVPAFAQTDAVHTHLTQAQAHLDNEKFEQAAFELEKAIALEPATKGAYYQLGYAYWMLERYSEARKAFEQELRFDPPDPYSLYYLGRISAAGGDHRGAIRYLARAIAISPVLDAHQRLGTAYLHAGDLARAIESYEAAVKLEPGRSDAHYQLGRAYLRAGRKADAAREFEATRRLKGAHQQQIRDLMQCEQFLKENRTGEALALADKLASSDDLDLLVSVGSLVGRHAHHTQASKYLERAVQLGPSFEALFNLAVTRLALKEVSGAVQALNEALRLNPESYEARALLGTLLAQQGNDEASLPHLRKAVELGPDNPRLLVLLGLTYAQGRYYEDAIDVLRRAIALQPDDAELRFLLVQAHYMNQDAEQALAEARKAADDFPVLAKGQMVLALQLHNMGRFGDARPCLEKALEMDPDLIEAHGALGDVLLRQGELEQSLRHFRIAVERRPDLAEPHVGLGKALLQLKRYDEAVGAMEYATRLHPEQAQPHLYLSQAYRALGRFDEAKRHAELFDTLNRQRMQKRDREVARRYVR